MTPNTDRPEHIGQPNAGPEDVKDRRDTDPNVAYEFRGVVRWIDPAAMRVVVRVEHGNHHAGRFIGSDVTFDLSECKLTVADADHDGAFTQADVVPGLPVALKARLPVTLPTELPSTVRARSLVVEDLTAGTA